MTGFSEIRLYQNTASTIPIGVYTDVTAELLSSAVSSTVVEGVSYVYDGCMKTVSGLLPGTQYWFWVEALDEAGNSSGISPLGSVTTYRALTFRIREINSTNLLDFTQFRLDGQVMDPASVEFASWLTDPKSGFTTANLFDGSNSTRYYQEVATRAGFDTFTVTVPVTAQTFSITPFRANRVPGWDIIENGVVIASTNRGSDGSGAQYVTRNYNISL